MPSKKAKLQQPPPPPLEESQQERDAFPVEPLKPAGPEELWGKKSVLTIDGGGIGGYSSLLVIQALMKSIQEIETTNEISKPTTAWSDLKGDISANGCRPCLYFDFTAGSGSGGIIAAMLGRNRMSLDKAMTMYIDLCTGGFENDTGNDHRWAEHLFSNKVVAENPEQLDRSCWTIAYAMQPFRKGDVDASPRYCSYDRADAALDMIKLLLRDFSLGHQRFSSFEVATRMNNPSVETIREVYHATRGSQWHFRNIDTVVSIGSVMCLPEVGSGTDSTRVYRLRLEGASYTEKVHEELDATSKQQSIDYHRLDIHPGFIDLGVDKLKTEITFDRIKRMTEAYLRRPEVTDHLHRIAERLVEKRRKRADTERWERWAFGKETFAYRCPYLNCDEDWCTRFQRRSDLSSHVGKHMGLEDGLSQGRIINALSDIGLTSELNSELLHTATSKFSRRQRSSDRQVRNKELLDNGKYFCAKYGIPGRVIDFLED